MDLTNQRDDPHGVQALLARLRQQQEASSSSSSFLSSSSAPPPSSTHTSIPGLSDSWAAYPPPTATQPSVETTSGRRRNYNVQPPYGSGVQVVDEYDAQTQEHEPYTPTSVPVKSKTSFIGTTGTTEAVATSPPAVSPSSSSAPPPPATTTTALSREELRDLTFPSSLAHLSRLSSDPTFLTSLRTLKTSQHDLERTLSTSYLRFRKSLRPSLDANTRRYEEKKFVNNLMQKWEEGVRQQQIALQDLGVPCCFESDDVARSKTMKKVVEVLEGMLEE